MTWPPRHLAAGAQPFFGVSSPPTRPCNLYTRSILCSPPSPPSAGLCSRLLPSFPATSVDQSPLGCFPLLQSTQTRYQPIFVNMSVATMASPALAGRPASAPAATPPPPAPVADVRFLASMATYYTPPRSSRTDDLVMQFDGAHLHDPALSAASSGGPAANGLRVRAREHGPAVAAHCACADAARHCLRGGWRRNGR
ncbi:hypothetical protein AMAG_09671 [Allomyces macrogynus ATCC 38327]|uniref:Uncharacterized protein n=1 Tax=Allomyces macrogynus (strain ATCC 38327) TaxID=578462 RepID=A0A0L0ST50_ALLM3|nr:hypothetical protein AMAG_09671 [Allomyces macrogynus ATCC 38327]|eukprot:KNE65687.1 hypothetical protein AMAG_09671 [Allomyces macrogynus ATCC 38327]